MDVEARKNAARALERDGRVEEALAAYRALLLDLEQTNAIRRELALYVKAGDLSVKTGDVRGGAGLYGRAARYYAELGSAQSVVALCAKILRATPTQTFVYPRLARIMIVKGHIEAARQLLIDYAVRTKQEAGRDALERLAGLPDQQVESILEKLLDAAEKRERILAERRKLHAAEEKPEPTPTPAPAREPGPDRAEAAAAPPPRDPDLQLEYMSPDEPVQEPGADERTVAEEPDLQLEYVSPDEPVQAREPEADEPAVAEEPDLQLEYVPPDEPAAPAPERAESAPHEPELQLEYVPPEAPAAPEPQHAPEPEPDPQILYRPPTEHEPEPTPAPEPIVPHDSPPEPVPAPERLAEFDAPAFELDPDPELEVEAPAEPVGAEPSIPAAAGPEKWEEELRAPEPEPRRPPREPSGRPHIRARSTDAPVVFTREDEDEGSKKRWLVVGGVVVVASVAGLFATGILGGGGADTPEPRPGTPAQTTAPPTPEPTGAPTSDSTRADSAPVAAPLATAAADSAAVAFAADTAPDTLAASADEPDSIAVVAGAADALADSTVQGDSSAQVAPPPGDTLAVPAIPAVAPNQPRDTTPQALLASLGRPAVIVSDLPLRGVREITSGGASGVSVEQALSSGERIFVVTMPFTGDSAAVGVVSLGDSAVGTVRVGNFLVHVSGRVSTDTLEALVRRLTVARSN